VLRRRWARGVARVAISGGRTPKAMFALLADRRAVLCAVPWEKLQLFWVDERCVPPTDADSNYRMTNEAMLAHVPLPAAQISSHGG
jgi:6-phosphogluconolactonase